jgi:hypothetical protein
VKLGRRDRIRRQAGGPNTGAVALPASPVATMTVYGTTLLIVPVTGPRYA